jgi:hypothetical protein
VWTAAQTVPAPITKISPFANGVSGSISGGPVEAIDDGESIDTDFHCQFRTHAPSSAGNLLA